MLKRYLRKAGKIARPRRDFMTITEGGREKQHAFPMLRNLKHRILRALGLVAVLAVGLQAQTQPMSVSPNSDFIIAAAAGKIKGVSVIHKFGSNPACSTNEEDVWFGGGTYPWPIAASTVRIRAGGDAADTSDGAGARSIKIIGLDASWTEISNDLTTAGASASAASTSTFMRVYRAYVTGVGGYGLTNVADITVETVSGSSVAVIIPAARGQSQMSMFTIPAGKTGYFLGGFMSASNSKANTIRLAFRTSADTATPPFSPVRYGGNVDELNGVFDVIYGVPVALPAKTDVWTTCKTVTGASVGTTDYDIILYDNR